MDVSSIDFLLAPDASSARRIKKQLAEEAPGLYRMAGTWPELMAQADVAYLLPTVSSKWREKIKRAVYLQDNAFWTQSLEVAPRETIVEIDAALNRILEAGGPDNQFPGLLDHIPEGTRLHQRLTDMSHLLEGVDDLPEPIQIMARILTCDEAPLRPIRVYRSKHSKDLNAWQHAVLDRLARDAPGPEPLLQTLVEDALASPVTIQPALKAVRNLYGSATKSHSKIDGVRVIAVRDSLAEAEIVTGFIQQAIDKGTRPSDIGLLLPGDGLSLMVVENVLDRCGLPLSGFHRPKGQRDIGRETLRLLLLCLRKPAPIMAITALLSSPLMPWSAQDGQKMAQAVMSGDVLLKSAKGHSHGKTLMHMLDKGITAPADLQRHLSRFMVFISDKDARDDHWLRAHETVNHLQTALNDMVELDWDRLLYLVAPESLKSIEAVDYCQEGLSIFHEGALPWCSVRHLFVLGFNDSHYPAGRSSSAVFTEAEWEQIAHAGWPIVTNQRMRESLRERFAEQLGAATESLTLLYAARDAGGKALDPSSSLVFIARNLGVESDDLVLDLDRSEDVLQIQDLPRARIAQPSSPRELIAADIKLKVDLLKAFSRKAGELVPLSPSAAETLMVSPFAWLLGRLGCDPRSWNTDNFDILKAGTLAHRVFEELFQAGQQLPSEDDIKSTLPKILQKTMLQIAPFLRSPDWRVERYKYESELLHAAIQWARLLTSCDAKIVAAEQWLRGYHGEIPLHGQSDLLVELPSGKLLVVDYKKSSSGTRRKRMRSGYDLQAHLYRMMIQTGGLAGFESPPTGIGVVYYLLNDTTALASSQVANDNSVPGWDILDSDISSHAMQHLDRRLTQIRSGTVQLNSDQDEAWWSRHAHLPIYALDNSPLLRLFMRSEEVPS